MAPNRQMQGFQPLGDQRLERAIRRRGAPSYVTAIRPDLNPLTSGPLIRLETKPVGLQEALHLVGAFLAQAS